jgi:glycosyltransferase involved in cell wall biosynthesis
MKYYRRDSVLIPPPVAVGKFSQPLKNREYYIAHSRLVRQKGLDLIIKTCIRYNLPLKIIGEGYLRHYLSSISDKTITYLGRVTDQNLHIIYKKAYALLFCAIDEDFGIVPVEAMSFGIPVIGYKSGGVAETVVQDKTGILFDSFNSESLYKAIRKLRTTRLSPQDCYNQALKYGATTFGHSFAKLIIKHYGKKNIYNWS